MPRKKKTEKINGVVVEEPKGEVIKTADVHEEVQDNSKEEVKQELAELKTETQTVTDSEPKQKRKYTRRAKVETLEDTKQSEAIEQAKRSFGMFADTLLTILEPRLPNPVPFSPAERELFSNSCSAMVEKYAPMMNGWDIEISFTLACVVILAPRIKRNEPTSIQQTTQGSFDFRQNGLREIIPSETANTTV